MPATAISLTDAQQVTIRPRFVTRKGNPAPVDGLPEYVSSNPDVVAVRPAVDGLSATLYPNLLGTATVTVSADADLGAGVVPITGSVEVTVTSATADHVAIDAEEPVEQEPAEAVDPGLGEPGPAPLFAGRAPRGAAAGLDLSGALAALPAVLARLDQIYHALAAAGMLPGVRGA